MKFSSRLFRLGYILMATIFTFSSHGIAADDDGTDRPVDIECQISVTPDRVACGQGVATVSLDATTTVCSDGTGTPSQDLCPDLALVWRTSAPGVDGNVPELSEQGAPQTELTIATEQGGVSIGSFNVQLIATSFSNNLKVICYAPVLVEECTYDCNGDLGGTAVIDDCGICGGDNSSCSDCAGTPNGDAILDTCGVCGGNGSSCLNCESLDITPNQLSLDGTSQQLEAISQKAIRAIRRASGNNRAFQKLSNAAHEAYRESWSAIWSLDSVQLSNCSSTILCVESDNTASTSIYQQSLDEIFGVTKRVTRKLRKKYAKNKVARRLLRLARNLRSSGTTELQSLPASQQTCLE